MLGLVSAIRGYFASHTCGSVAPFVSSSFPPFLAIFVFLVLRGLLGGLLRFFLFVLAPLPVVALAVPLPLPRPALGQVCAGVYACLVQNWTGPTPIKVLSLHPWRQANSI